MMGIITARALNNLSKHDQSKPGRQPLVLGGAITGFSDINPTGYQVSGTDIYGEQHELELLDSAADIEVVKGVAVTTVWLDEDGHYYANDKLEE